ncbi:MAG: F0F1 ATP synthase subunit delta [Chloroflexota bacterium]
MPRPSTAARRYAEAVLEIARRDETQDAWQLALAAASRVFGSADVLHIVENPAIPLPQRLDAVRAALGPEAIAQPVGAQLANLTGALVARRRVSLIPPIAGEYGRLLDRHRGIAAAVVTSAIPLTADETAAIGARVEVMTGATVSLRTAVDPALIGGVTVRIGDRLIDASVRGRLERLRDRIVAGAR